MYEKLAKYAGLLPLVAVFVYLFGYVMLNAYLNNFGITENVALDERILSLGILYLVIIAPIILVCFATFKFGDYRNVNQSTYPELIDNLHDAFGYSLLYALSLGALLLKTAMDNSTIVVLGILAVAAIINKVPMKSTVRMYLKGAFMISSFFIYVTIGISGVVSPKTWFYLVVFMAFLTCIGLRIFNKEGTTYQASRIAIVVTTLLALASTVGANLIGHIPAQYGGEKRDKIVYFLDMTAVDKLKRTQLKPYIEKDNSVTMQSVYQNSDRIYFLTPNQYVLSIPKSFVESEQVKVPKYNYVDR
ncbi:hypothetical protein [Pararcticibacter amylolyticus]|uniref:Uncharacterized protein n=1 Tax=Pararcticibacter amylolyticus TaxID=2173175 RepID=A0A2U2PHD1_9SPHI|nr:hypothetical protein [Pararcticibacter amylolyticus]PWG80662.1 hypothetical protein DDR33_11625 [Pararcticibacter amylolyticus]